MPKKVKKDEKPDNGTDSRREAAQKYKQQEIEKLLVQYRLIGDKMAKILPMVSEVLADSIDFNNKIKYETTFRYRLKSILVFRTLSVAHIQIRKIIDYINLVCDNKDAIVSEFIGKESVFE